MNNNKNLLLPHYSNKRHLLDQAQGFGLV